MVDHREDTGQRGGRRPRLTVFRLGILVAVLTVIVSSVVLALGYSGGSPTVPVLNTPVPRVDLTNLISGAEGISDASLQGKAVILNFWASWCAPCQSEMPTLEAAHRALGNRVTFIGVDEQDGRQAATSFLRSVGVTYGNGFDPNGAAGQSFSTSRGLRAHISSAVVASSISRRVRSRGQVFARACDACSACRRAHCKSRAAATSRIHRRRQQAASTATRTAPSVPRCRRDALAALTGSGCSPSSPVR